jgi:hypothetical protein
MNGAFGDERYGLRSTERTANVASLSPPTSARARASSTTMTLAFGRPVDSKSRPLATFVPSTPTSSAANEGAVAVTSSMSQ